MGEGDARWGNGTGRDRGAGIELHLTRDAIAWIFRRLLQLKRVSMTRMIPCSAGPL